MKAALLPVLVLTLQLLAADSKPLYGQTTNLHQFATNPLALSPVRKVDKMSTNEAAQAPQYLPHLIRPNAPETGPTRTLTTEIAGAINDLEWTGEYVERYVRVPEGNSGQAKLIRFLIPVYREKGTQRKISVGTEDKRTN